MAAHIGDTLKRKGIKKETGKKRYDRKSYGRLYNLLNKLNLRMEMTRKILLICLMIFIIPESYLTAQEVKCVELPAFVGDAISKETETNRGAEYCEYREVAFGDLDNDKQQDIAVAYTIEGTCTEADEVELQPGTCGNKASQFLMVFTHENKIPRVLGPIIIGERGGRAINSLAIKNSTIEAETLEWAESDPMCCPSKKGRTRFTIDSGKLKELIGN
jgi:hypothetical protein